MTHPAAGAVIESGAGRVSPEQCPHCAYPLRGLPETGACPECGFQYNPGQLVIYGWEAAKFRNFENVRAAKLPRTLLTSVPISILSVFWIFFGRLAWWHYLLYAAFPLMPIWFSLLRRRRRLTEVPAPIQLRMQKEGYAMRLGYGEVKLVPWTYLRMITVEPKETIYFSVTLKARWGEEKRLEFDGGAIDAERFRSRVTELAGHAVKVIGGNRVG